MGSENDIQILRKGVYILKIKKEKSIIFRKIIYWLDLLLKMLNISVEFSSIFLKTSK